MAVLRENPYPQFNFLVNLGTGDSEGFEAGFQECSGISMSVDVIEYRNGNERENSTRKITGLNRVSDVTLKRGVIGSLNLYQWLDQIRNGDAGRGADGHDPASERGPHEHRHDVEAPSRSHHQAHERSAEREGHRRHDRGDDARLRAPRDRVGRTGIRSTAADRRTSGNAGGPGAGPRSRRRRRATIAARVTAVRSRTLQRGASSPRRRVHRPARPPFEARRRSPSGPRPTDP